MFKRTYKIPYKGSTETTFPLQNKFLHRLKIALTDSRLRKVTQSSENFIYDNGIFLSLLYWNMIKDLADLRLFNVRAYVFQWCVALGITRPGTVSEIHL